MGGYIWRSTLHVRDAYSQHYTIIQKALERGVTSPILNGMQPDQKLFPRPLTRNKSRIME
jgi:hypothetical protein